MTAASVASEEAGAPPRVILLDIEGTTSSIDFVHRTLFPYARERLAAWVRARAGEPRVRAALAEVEATLAEESAGAGGEPSTVSAPRPPAAGAVTPPGPAGDVAPIAALLRWIDVDRKHPALKRIQGWIWDEGFRDGTLQGHVYDDVPGTLRRWRAQGLRLAIYSSGSVDAQKALFGHTSAGDLLPLFEAHFDTAVGGKREVKSYVEIARRLGVDPADVLFLSDVVAELDAAREAGMRTRQVVRAGTAAGRGHAVVEDLGGLP